MAIRPYIVGNWKMHGTRAMLSEARTIDRAAQRHMKVEVAVAPPYTLIHAVHREVEQIGVGAQDCHPKPLGSFTGDISASMLADAGAKFVIIGHSERRSGHDEDDKLVKQKVTAALEAGMNVIICCGENLDVRKKGLASEFVSKQLRASLPKIDMASERLTIAYEPIWAIGSGNSANPEDIGDMHLSIREVLKKSYGTEEASGFRILYGGSVNPENAREILATPEVGGALVGGASLTADSFMGIALAAADLQEE